MEAKLLEFEDKLIRVLNSYFSLYMLSGAIVGYYGFVAVNNVATLYMKDQDSLLFWSICGGVIIGLVYVLGYLAMIFVKLSKYRIAVDDSILEIHGVTGWRLAKLRFEVANVHKITVGQTFTSFDSFCKIVSKVQLDLKVTVAVRKDIRKNRMVIQLKDGDHTHIDLVWYAFEPSSFLRLLGELRDRGVIIDLRAAR